MSRDDRVRLSLNGYRYFPYELTFAAREIASVLEVRPHRVADGFTIPASAAAPSRVRRLTYIDRAVFPDGAMIRPDQALLEESDGNSSVRRARRQSTRYSAHGIHEYRGKFNPQVVRAIGNMIGVQPHEAVLDPFCGSGTTLLEARHANWNATGIDLNPLGVLIANAKIAALRVARSQLVAAQGMLSERLGDHLSTLDFTREWSDLDAAKIAGAGWRESLPDYQYLAAWIPIPALAQLVAILEVVQHLPKATRPIFLAIISDLVREVSLQDPNDLRIRRRKDPAPNYPVIPLFLERVARQVARILKARDVLEPTKTHQEAFLADSRQSLSWLLAKQPPFDAVITSPPYATALPYIDTQRLSLTLLGLVKSTEIGTLEREVTGSREIRPAERRTLEAVITGGAHDERETVVPAEVQALCARLSVSIDRNTDGFRRQNMPALVYKYFSDMAESFKSVHSVTRARAKFALVVGPNRSTLGGEEIVIDTPRLLGKTAEMHGWRLCEALPMDAYSRFGLHQANSIRTEMLVLLERR